MAENSSITQLLVTRLLRSELQGAIWLCKFRDKPAVSEFLEEVVGEYAKGPWGKPYAREVGRRQAVFWNLSHSRDNYYLAISDRPVGIDIEELEQKPRKISELAERWFAASERESGSTDMEKFLQLWCRKEALAKLYGLSLFHVVGEPCLYPYEETRRQTGLGKLRWRRYPSRPQNYFCELQREGFNICLAARKPQQVIFAE